LFLGTALCLGFVLPVRTTQAGLTQEQKEKYAKIRKNYFIAASLPPDERGRLRKGHRRYLKAVTDFITSLGEEEPFYRAAAHYYRGRVLMRAKLLTKAREDFDKSIELMGAEKDEDLLPPGLPARNSIRILRAFTFREDGVDALVQELQDLPEDEGEDPKLFEVGSGLTKLADSLADADRVTDAIKLYEIIKRFDLWEDELDDPQRKIDLLKYRLKAGGGGEP